MNEQVNIPDLLRNAIDEQEPGIEIMSAEDDGDNNYTVIVNKTEYIVVQDYDGNTGDPIREDKFETLEDAKKHLNNLTLPDGWKTSTTDHNARIEKVVFESQINCVLDDGEWNIHLINFGIKWEIKEREDIGIFKSLGIRESGTNDLIAQCGFNLSGDVSGEYKAQGLKINIRGSHRGKYSGKYSALWIEDANEKQYGKIELRIADHSYNPRNVYDFDAGFISVVIANTDETAGKFGGKHNLYFNGESDYDDIVSAVREKIQDILDGLDFNEGKTNLSKGGTIMKKKPATIAQLKQAIASMEELVNDPEVSEDYKDSVRPSITEAKRLLAEAEAKKPADHFGRKKGEKAAKEKVSELGAKATKMLAGLEETVAEFNRGRSKASIENDAEKKAKAPGKRVSDTGNTYYEERSNRSDINQDGKPFLEEGGEVAVVEIQEVDVKDDTIKSAVHIARIAHEKGIVASKLTFAEFAYEVFDKTRTSYPKYKLQLAYDTLKGRGLEEGGFIVDNDNVDAFVVEQYAKGGEIYSPYPYDQSGENINVFGYETKNFTMCRRAVEQFKVGMAKIDVDFTEDGYEQLMKNNLATLAKYVDDFFGIEKLYYTQAPPDIDSFGLLASQLVSIGIWSYKSNLEVNTDFLGKHLGQIAFIYGRESDGYVRGGEIHSHLDEGSEVVFKADSKGGKYSIEVVTKKGNDGKEYWSYNTFVNGRTDGAGFYNDKDRMLNRLDDIINDSQIDGIKYTITNDKIGVRKMEDGGEVPDEIPEIVKRAMTETITDIGQLTPDQKKALEKYVKKGVLIKGKGGPFPTEKTVYAIKGFDIHKARVEDVKELTDTAEKRDRLTGMGKLHDKTNSVDYHYADYVERMKDATAKQKKSFRASMRATLALAAMNHKKQTQDARNREAAMKKYLKEHKS